MDTFSNASRSVKRWREVQMIMLRYGFGYLFDKDQIHAARASMNRRLHRQAAVEPAQSLPERVRLMLEELGPTYVKFGQILSSRSDILPPDWISELSRLQDKVPPFAYDDVKKIIQDELGDTPEALYLEFEPVPFAAASIGQVHRARLSNNEPVVVKVRRPGIVQQVKSDIEILRELANLLKKRTDWGKKLDLVAIIDEFALTIADEMDYSYEGNHADRLRHNMQDQGKVGVPRIIWNLSTSAVLTMEAMDGIKIDQLDELDAAGVDRPEIAKVFIHAMIKQVLIDGFYHADPHPGNLIVIPETQTLVFIDLGMVGSLMAEQRKQLDNVVQAMLKRDSAEVTHLLLEIGTSSENIDTAKLVRTVDRIINRYLDAPLEKISVANLFSEIMKTVFTYGIQMPSEFSVIAKTLVQSECIARMLDPQIAITDILRTVSEQLIWQKLAPETVTENLVDSLKESIHLMQEIPRSAQGVLRSLEKGKLQVGIDFPDLCRSTIRLSEITNRATAGLVVTGMLIGSAIAMGVAPEGSWSFIPLLGVVGFVGSMIAGFILIWGSLVDFWKNRRK